MFCRLFISSSCILFTLIIDKKISVKYFFKTKKNSQLYAVQKFSIYIPEDKCKSKLIIMTMNPCFLFNLACYKLKMIRNYIMLYT